VDKRWANMSGSTTDQRFTAGLDVLLDGLKHATPAPTRHTTDHHHRGHPGRNVGTSAIARLGGMPHIRPGCSGQRPHPLPWPGRGSRFASQPAGRACPLPPAPTMASTWVDSSEMMEGGTST
jgi:hypothetical protein